MTSDEQNKVLAEMTSVAGKKDVLILHNLDEEDIQLLRHFFWFDHQHNRFRKFFSFVKATLQFQMSISYKKPSFLIDLIINQAQQSLCPSTFMPIDH